MSHTTYGATRALFRKASLVLPLLFLVLFGGLVPRTTAEDSPGVEKLKQDAGNAFVKGDYALAATLDLEIAEKHPGSDARHYAVQMLGTIYENNLVDLKKAIQWDREFLTQCAGPQQAPYYKDKIASLEKLASQEQSFKAYQSILFANQGDEVEAQRFEAFLKQYPDFQLRDKVESELGNLYARLDQQKKAAAAFQTVVEKGETKLSSSDLGAYTAADRYAKMRSTWAYVAWAVIAILWAAVLLMKPWQRLTRAEAKKFLLWPGLWLVVIGLSIPLFCSLETMGYRIIIPATTVYLAAALNLVVLFWFMLLLKGKYWQNRPRTLRWFSPVLMLLMTTGVFYLWVAYQPNGPYIVDECVVKYAYWRGECREWLEKHHSHGQLAGGQGGGTVTSGKDE
jgi:tetratricopeptide (TPR) repeat protein